MLRVLHYCPYCDRRDFCSQGAATRHVGAVHAKVAAQWWLDKQKPMRSVRTTR